MITVLPEYPQRPSLTSRCYKNEDDLRKMQQMLMEARALTSDWRFAHVGELMWDYFMITCHLNPQEHILLWHDPQGRLVAYALLGEDPSFNCQVLPEYQWSGIETEALTLVKVRISELSSHNPHLWIEPLVTGIRQDDTKRIAFLEQHGFSHRGEFDEVNMLRSLEEEIPGCAIPEGYQVRGLAETGETSNRAGSVRDVWLPWTVGNVSDEDYVRLMRLPGYQRELDVVAVAPDGVIAAYVNCWTDPLNCIGDFGPVGARPAYRRKGLTRAVLLEGMRRLKALGMDRVCVSTGVSNLPAQRLYESVGFRIVNRYLDYTQTAREIGYS